MEDKLFDEEDINDDIINEIDKIDNLEISKETSKSIDSTEDDYNINENTNLMKFLKTEIKFTENFRKKLTFTLLSENSKNIYKGYPLQEIKGKNAFVFNLLKPVKKLCKIYVEDISICI